jgi:hypothetical protein
MIPLIAGAAVSIGSAIFGGIKARKARKAQERLIASQNRANDEWYNKNYYADYMQNADVQSALGQLRDQIQQNSRRTAGAMAMTGGTDEARLAAQSAGNRTYSDAIRGIAGQATAYKRNIDAQYQQNRQNILGMKMDMVNQDAASASQLMQNGINAGVGLIQSSNWGSKAKSTGTGTGTVADYMGSLGYNYDGKGTFTYGG